MHRVIEDEPPVSVSKRTAEARADPNGESSELITYAGRTVGLVAAVLTLSAFVWHHHGAIGIDRWLLHGYVVRRDSAGFHISELLTELGSPGVVVVLGVLLAVFVWTRRRSWPQSLACLVAPGAAGVAETLGKAIVGRQRPPTAVLTGESGVGFPSGHATGFAAFALIAALVLTCDRGRDRRTVRFAVSVAVVASALMAATRVIVGAHYPTDVIAGALLGLVIADTTWMLARAAIGHAPQTKELSHDRPGR